MSSWMNKLRSTELHRLAVLLGTPSSGTKALRIQGIEDAIKQTRTAPSPSSDAANHQNADIRLLSIDMGVKNLAYAFFTTSKTAPSSSTTSSYPPATCTLQEWRKFDISAPNTGSEALPTDEKGVSRTAYAYHPAIYAGHAYRFVQTILNYKPSHIVIERQRFRSAGGPAVQEWSIRVGVFEAMLWSVLRTLIEQSTVTGDGTRTLDLDVESVLPARVNQFWLDGEADRVESDGTTGQDVDKPGRLSGRDMKKAKIKLVMALLDQAGSQDAGKDGSLLAIGESRSLRDQVSMFRGDAGGPSRVGKGRSAGAVSGMGSHSKETMSATRIGKLDDLADCLLQGMAWLHWRNNRIKVIEHGQDAFNWI